MSRSCVSFVLAAAWVAGLAEGLPSAPAPLPRREVTVAGDWERLRGTWKVTRFECRGEADGEAAGREVVFGRGSFTWPWDSYPPMACRLGPGEPRRFDARGGPTEEYPAELVLRGIYRLDGDTLTVCYYSFHAGSPEAEAFGLTRPVEFETADQPAAMLVLKRKAK
jgi:uncharacterized protein (TIGR03067 family)